MKNSTTVAIAMALAAGVAMGSVTAEGQTGSVFAINPVTHAIVRNGEDVFPLVMYAACDYWTTSPTCTEAMERLTNFDYSENGMSVGPNSGTYGAPFWAATTPVYEASGVWYDVNFHRYAQADVASYSLHDEFFGFYFDETDVNPADAESWAYTLATSPLIKARYPNKLRLAAYWGDFTRLSTISDVIQFSAFTHTSTHNVERPGGAAYVLSDYIFAAEATMHQGMVSDCGTCTSLNSIPGSVWVLWMAVGSQWRESDSMVWEAVTPQEMRAEAYWTITTDAKGMGYWTYRLPAWSGGRMKPEALALNEAQVALYNDLAGEVQGLESIILLPTVAHSWGGTRASDGSAVGVRDRRVTFSPNPTRHMTSWGYDQEYLSYSLKQSGSTSYLFVANKAATPLDNVVVTIGGLEGPMTARVLGSTLCANVA